MREPRFRLVRALGVLLLITTNQPALGQGAAQDSGAVNPIRKLYGDVNTALERGGAKGERYCETEDGWKRSSARGAEDDPDCDPLAMAFQLDGRIRKVAIERVAVSGDWTNRVEYYFYKDGKTAFRFERHLTFNGGAPDADESDPGGPYVVETRTYYDPSGEQVRELVRAFRKETGEDISPRYVQSPDQPRYKSVQELPFLKSARTKK
jgi:hypothetical protein